MIIFVLVHVQPSSTLGGDTDDLVVGSCEVVGISRVVPVVLVMKASTN